MSNNNVTLPKAPKDLCFSELDFVQVSTNFSLDTFTVSKEIDTILFYYFLCSVYRKILMSIIFYKIIEKVANWRQCVTILACT